MPAPSIPCHQIVMVVFPGFLLLDLAGPLQVFAMADEEAGRQARPTRYRLRTVSAAGGMQASSCGLMVQTESLPRPATLRGATVLVVGGDGIQDALHDRRLLRWLQAASTHVARCGSVCTGAFLLAQAGLLDGRRAVTHWMDVPRFRAMFPRVQLMDDSIHVRDGQIHTSAGVTAGMDLSLALVEADHDRALSLRVAKRLVIPYRRAGGQRQFSTELLAQLPAEEGLSQQLLQWLRPRLRQSIGVGDMAAAMAMSERTLHRQLMAQAGMTPARLLHRMRVERACWLLEDGKTSLKRVVQQTGLGSEYNLRRAFRLVLGVSPNEYQSRFSARAAAAPSEPLYD